MSRTMRVLLAATVMWCMLVSSVLAGGDQVRGENGEGQVRQVQVQDPPPFHP